MDPSTLKTVQEKTSCCARLSFDAHEWSAQLSEAVRDCGNYAGVFADIDHRTRDLSRKSQWRPKQLAD